MKRILLSLAVLVAALAAAGCASGEARPVPPAISSPAVSASPVSEEPVPPPAEEYTAGLARKLAGELISPDMDDVGKIAAVYRYMVENVYFAEPPLPELWRLRGRPDAPPPYLYSRALWPLDCGIGSCEDFAAALTLILREAGFHAEYVSGLTVSARRDWVDHAWTVVRLGDAWYHLDCQLEQNVLKNGILDYRYFLRDDEWMLADHLWGGWLAAYWKGFQTPGQRRTLLEAMTPPLCQGPPVSRPGPVTAAMKLPDPAAVVEKLEREWKEYENTRGPLPPVNTNWEPPLFSVMPDRP